MVVLFLYVRCKLSILSIWGSVIWLLNLSSRVPQNFEVCRSLGEHKCPQSYCNRLALLTRYHTRKWIARYSIKSLECRRLHLTYMLTTCTRLNICIIGWCVRDLFRRFSCSFRDYQEPPMSTHCRRSRQSVLRSLLRVCSHVWYVDLASAVFEDKIGIHRRHSVGTWNLVNNLKNKIFLRASPFTRWIQIRNQYGGGLGKEDTYWLTVNRESTDVLRQICHKFVCFIGRLSG